MGKAFWHRDDSPDDRDEVEEHLRSLTEFYVAQGVPPAEAARRARLRFGNPAATLQTIRDLDRWNILRTFASDFRYAVRVLRRSPAFTLTVIATLAIGIGANSSVFSVIESVLLRPLPYPSANGLVGISYRSRDPKRFAPMVPSPVLLTWKGQSHAVNAFAAYLTGQTTFLTQNGEPIPLDTASVSTDFFAVLDPQALVAGRPLVANDAVAGNGSVALLSRPFARRYFGSDTAVLGHRIRLRDGPVTIVGLVAETFRFPASETPDVYTPLDLREGSATVVNVNVIGRLKPGATLEEATTDLDAVSRAARPTYPSAMVAFLAADPKPQVVPLAKQIAGDLESVLYLALGTVGCILLLASANVAGLFVARMAGRERELAMRTALGASPTRLAAWLLTESLVLATAGAMLGLFGLALAMASLRAVLAHAIPHADAIAIDVPVVTFTTVSLLIAAVCCASVPMRRIYRGSADAAVRLSGSGAVRDISSHRARRLMVTAQVGVAFTLMVGALLLADTFWRLTGVNLGFDQAQVETVKISSAGFDSARGATQVDDLLRRVRQLPGVVAAGVTTAFPLSGHSFGFTIALAGEPPPLPVAHDATGVDAISPGYLEALRVKILAGRGFDDRDGTTSPAVALVNAAFARANLPQTDPIGRRLSLGGGPEDANIAIVGVVDDVKDGPPGEAAQPTVYRPLSQASPQMTWNTAALAIRTHTDPDGLAVTVRRVVADVVPGSAVYDQETMQHRVAATVAPERLRAAVFGILAGTAVVLCMVGLYGLLASAVAESTREMGVRVALGAAKGQLIGLTLRRAVGPTAIGIVFGFGGAVGFAHLLANRLFGVGPLDVMTYAKAAGVLGLLSMVAAVVPAYRAATIDPIRVLRAD